MRPEKYEFRLRTRRNPTEPEAANPELSVVVPCYNESAVIGLMRERLVRALDQLELSWEIICVDDGSTDDTLDQLSEFHSSEVRLKIISLSRNFGQQAAIAAGLDCATGERVIIMDADLQDPPELLQPCLSLLKTGYDVVYAVRKSRKENLVKRTAYCLYYRVLRAISQDHLPINAGDFCMMSRRVLEVLKQMPEQDPFWRGLRAWAGFKQIGLEYERPARAAGETKYSFSKLLRLALDGLFSFSILPLRIATLAGLATVALAGSWAVLHIIWRVAGFELMGHRAAELPGWTTLMCGMFLLGGLQLVMLGCVGEYIGRIFREVKKRPRWIVQETLGFERDEASRNDTARDNSHHAHTSMRHTGLDTAFDTSFGSREVRSS